MKKIVAFTVALSMLVIFTGCRNQNNSCRWTPFKKDQTVCYTPCNTCDIPVVDDCCPCATPCGEPMATGCSTCSMGAPTVSTATPVVEPFPSN